MKSRRIPVGALYVASLVLVVVMIPIMQLAIHQPSLLFHRQSSAMALRIDKLKL